MLQLSSGFFCLSVPLWHVEQRTQGARTPRCSHFYAYVSNELCDSKKGCFFAGHICQALPFPMLDMHFNSVFISKQQEREEKKNEKTQGQL